MKTLSIKQPYAWAIVCGYKPVENRTWPTTFRGPVAIHAGKREIGVDVNPVVNLVARQTNRSFQEVFDEYHRNRHLGAIVGAAILIDCVTDHQSDWFSGPYGFVFDRAIPCYPVPTRGALGFFDVPTIECGQVKAPPGSGKE